MVERQHSLDHHPPDLLLFCIPVQAVKIHGPVHRPFQPSCIMNVEQKPVAGIVFHIHLVNGVMEASCIMDNGKGSVNAADHLGKAARLERGRHYNKIGSGKRLVGELFHKIAHRHPIFDAVNPDDLGEMHLEHAVGHKNHLKAVLPVFRHNAVENVRQKPASFLDRIKPGRPEKKRCVFIFLKPQGFLENKFVFRLLLSVIFGSEVEFHLFIHRRIEFGLRSVENPVSASCVPFVGKFLPQGLFDKRMSAVYDFLEKGRAHRIHVMGGKHPGHQKIHRVPAPALLVVVGRIPEIEIIPEQWRVNAPILDFLHCGGDRMNVVDREQTGNLELFCHCRHQSGHPVIAVNDIRIHPRDNIVQKLPLERQ